MGSLEKAIKTGFICRLCSEMNKVVIHIYSDIGLKLKLAERIHEHLPVTVTVTDPLPKTICWKCITRLEEQHVLVQRINQARQQLLNTKDALARAREKQDNNPSKSGSTERGVRVRARHPYSTLQLSARSFGKKRH